MALFRLNVPVSLILIFLFTGLAACTGHRPGFGSQPEIFQPPTAVVNGSTPVGWLPDSTSTPTLQPLESPRPASTPACVNILTFLEDITIPDGSVFTPGSVLDKRWRVENSGTCNWDQRYSVHLVSGVAMGLPETQALYPARSGTVFDIRMLFTAPIELGRYQSAWQAYDPEGKPFGDPFYMEILVENPPP